MISSKHGATPNRRNLMDESHRVSILISTSIIVLVQLISIAILAFFMMRNMNRNASITADEIQVVLIEPLYNVDDLQVIRIGEALLSSGRISGITVDSTATGRVLNRVPESVSRWIPPQSRYIEYKDIPLGTVTLYFNDIELKEIIQGILWIMLALIVGVICANYVAHHLFVMKRVAHVFGQLSSGINKIAAGQYDTRIAETGYADIDEIIRLMNDMSARIQAKNEELQIANTRLEQRVAERTLELEAALEEQKLLQDRLIESEKLTALGQLSAGIAHELNTPLGAIISANRTLTGYLDEKIPVMYDFLSRLDSAERSLYDATIRLGFKDNRTLNTAMPNRKIAGSIEKQLENRQIPESSKLAALLLDLGLSNHVTEIIPFLVTQKNLEIVSAAGETIIARRMAEIINESSQKAAGVVSAFHAYLSQEKGEENLVDISADISRVLTLMHNMLKHGINVQAELTPVMVLGSSDRLSQVWMNLIRNAAEAMKFKGELEIRTEIQGENAAVSVIDSGPGIPEEIRERIFEPFFTTKKKGEGMGLGLDICKRIVELHKGTITFKSQPGRTEFLVLIPAVKVDL
ncbi:MAG: GHKL domain-containing protein [Spirochaetales bacterium]|nr:GHKL domain-containing protein [Spirochaetales bacterium]